MDKIVIPTFSTSEGYAIDLPEYVAATPHVRRPYNQNTNAEVITDLKISRDKRKMVDVGNGVELEISVADLGIGCNEGGQIYLKPSSMTKVINAEPECLGEFEEESEDTWEGRDDHGHIAHVFRHEQFSKTKRKHKRHIGKLAKKARRK